MATFLNSQIHDIKRKFKKEFANLSSTNYLAKLIFSNYRKFKIKKNAQIR
jgi:di/tripeptidase